MQLSVENCTVIDINPLHKTVKKLVRKDYPESSIDEQYLHTLNELKRFTLNNQHFDYTGIKNHLGGFRWFFVCPKCKNKISKLLLPPFGSNKEHKYQCKACHKLKNQSALTGQNNMYRRVTKPLKRMNEIEEKINRGHLKPDLVQSLLDEYDMLERNMKESPEFRLYSFKKKLENKKIINRT